MQDGVDRVRGTVDLARNASATLGRIVDTSISSFEMSERISASLQQQAYATRSLHSTASKMSDHIGEDRRSIEEQARAALTEASPLGRMVEAAEVAQACAYLASDNSAAVTGEDLNVTAGVVMY